MLVMPISPKETYDKVEGLKGKKLVFTLAILFVLFVFVGIAIGNFISPLLRKNEIAENIENTYDIPKKESLQYKGRVTYVDPQFYPQDGISYYLADETGTEIILLKTDDEKLTVVEGLEVIVFGELQKTKEKGEDVLMVEKVVVKN
jgi:hypothetical protein